MGISGKDLLLFFSESLFLSKYHRLRLTGVKVTHIGVNTNLNTALSGI